MSSKVYPISPDLSDDNLEIPTMPNTGRESDTAEEHNEEVDFEDAISRTGYGRFHYLLLILCGWAVSSDAIELLSISFVLPPAGCDMNLTTYQKGTLNSSIFIGMMIGGYCWGSLSDIFGRRRVLMICLTLNAFAALTSSFIQNYYAFVFLRLVSGIGVGGAQPVLFTYFAEFQPKKRRGSMVSFMASFWVSGNILAAGLAWLVIPRADWRFQTNGFTYDSWRIYLALCTLPSFTSAVFFLVLPESPKYLLQMGRAQEALTVLGRVFSLNKGSDASFYDVKSLAFMKTAPVKVQVDGARTGVCAKSIRAISKFLTRTRRLFRRSLLRTTLVSVYVYSTLSFGYYGLFMWFPELFTRMAQYGGSACDNTYENSTTIPTQSPAHHNHSCIPDNSEKIYLESFITALSTMPGNILAVFIMDRIGGRLLLSLGMVGSGISVFFLWFVHNETQGLIISCIFSGISNIGWVALDVLAVESFPTDVRSTSSGFLMIAARMSGVAGNVVFGAMVNSNCTIPMVLVMFFLSSGGLTALLLPNNRRSDID